MQDSDNAKTTYLLHAFICDSMSYLNLYSSTHTKKNLTVNSNTRIGFSGMLGKSPGMLRATSASMSPLLLGFRSLEDRIHNNVVLVFTVVYFNFSHF